MFVHCVLYFFFDLQILIDECYVPDTSPGFHYTNTVLGAIFAISGLPKIPGGNFEYFQKPMEEVSIFYFMIFILCFILVL